MQRGLLRQSIHPLATLQREMNQLLETLFGSGGSSATPEVAPVLDMKEDDETVTVTVELPGVAANDVQVSVRNLVLEIEAQKSEQGQDEQNLHTSERSRGTFARRVRLPEKVDSNRAEASMENGVLHLTLPKREARGRRQIRIPGGDRDEGARDEGARDERAANPSVTVADLMTPHVTHVARSAMADEAVKKMAEHDIGCLPVVDAEQRVVGIVTDRDICLSAASRNSPLSKLPVSEAMTKEVVAVTPSTSIDQAERLLRDRQLHRLPVIDEQRRAIGMISLNDIARAATGRRGQGQGEEGLSKGEVAETVAAIAEPHHSEPGHAQGRAAGSRQ
jgi:HSP20 family protein